MVKDQDYLKKTASFCINLAKKFEKKGKSDKANKKYEKAIWSG